MGKGRWLGRSMGVLLAGILLFHAGWYMLLPYFAILFTTRRGLTPAEVGVVLAAQSLSLLAGSLAGGSLADRIGRKPTMLSGLVLRAVGVGALGLAAEMPGLLVAAGVAGLGGGLYGPAAKAGIALLATGEERTAAFSLRGIAANVGTSGGPLLGSLLVGGPMPVLFGAAAALHAGLAAATWGLLREPSAPQEPEARAWGAAVADSPYLVLSLVTTLAWALFSQLSLAVPLHASRVLGLQAMIGLLWTASSLVVILLQTTVTRWLLGRLHPLSAMGAGTALMGAGLGLVAFARSFGGLLGAVMVFVVGEMLLLPVADTAVSLMARREAVGSYFGLSSFTWGLGEGLGNLAGGALMQYALTSGRVGLPWGVYAVAGAVIGGLCWGLRRWQPLDARLRPAPLPESRRIHLYRPGQPATDDALRLGPRERE